MHNYIFRNTNNFTIVIKNNEGVEHRLKPNEIALYKSEQGEVSPVLSYLYENEGVGYWHIDLACKDKVEWKKEGF